MRGPRGVSGNGVIIHCKLVNFIKENIHTKKDISSHEQTLAYARKHSFHSFL